ncbi:MAG: sulfite exporter TauE/SafE family protein [Thermoanaerobaculales bacterium]
MDAFSLDLLIAAAAIALTHTVLGPDHTLPFVMLAQARGWSQRRTLVVTFLCGLGHVGSSVVLGVVGLALGFGVAHLTAAENARGGLAAWALVAFGLAYAVWGVRHAVRQRTGLVPHVHHGHVHLHTQGEQRHEHAGVDRSRTTFWALFTIFVLGPCEPLIPLFVLPASRGRWETAALTAVVFSVITIATMLTLVSLALSGVKRLPLAAFERWSHALAGAVIAGSGLIVIVLGV